MVKRQSSNVLNDWTTMKYLNCFLLLFGVILFTACEKVERISGDSFSKIKVQVDKKMMPQLDTTR